MMPKVSIIVPIYNVQEYLRECLDSLLSQTLPEIEIICVNDGSTDHSPEILDSYAALDARVKVMHKENSGYGASMNQGIRAASGEYIGIVEPDDYVETEMYEELYRQAKEFQLDWIKGNFQVFKGSGERRRNSIVKTYSVEAKKLYHKVLNPQEYPELIVHDDFHWKGIYQKDFLERNHIAFHETPGAAYQDNGFKYQTTCLAERAMFIDKAFYWYRRDNPSASTYNTKGLELMYREYEFIKEFMENNQERTKGFLAAYYKKFYLQFYDQLIKLLNREWEEVQLGEIFELYRKELSLGVEQGFCLKDIIGEWYYNEIKLFVRYPRSFFEYHKIREEVRLERYKNWYDNLKGRKVVLVCAGIKARQVINFTDSNPEIHIEAICDNNQNKWGQKLYHLSIISPAQAVKEYPDGYFLIAKAWDTKELQEQLLEMGVPADRIEPLSIGLDGFSSVNCIV
ncbi:MAG: glycosyltransferase [Lachnospiraceae bacterium]|nr:glycosyltransferase [Lachnospiraceae bacterium]